MRVAFASVCLFAVVLVSWSAIAFAKTPTPTANDLFQTNVENTATAQARTPTPTADEYQATIDALETQVAEPEPTATTTPTPRPTNTPTLTPAPTVNGSATIQGFITEDSSIDCDRIGWSVDNEEDLEGDTEHFASCTDAGMMYVALCGRTAGENANPFLQPAANNDWMVCIVVAMNIGSDFGLVSPLDFAFVDGNNRRYESSFTALSAMDPGNWLPTSTLSIGQNAQGAIAFEVPKSLDLPGYIEIGGTGFGLSDPGIIIVEELPRS